MLLKRRREWAIVEDTMSSGCRATGFLRDLVCEAMMMKIEGHHMAIEKELLDQLLAKPVIEGRIQ